MAWFQSPTRNRTMLKHPPKSCYLCNAGGDILCMINRSKLWQRSWELNKILIRLQEIVQCGHRKPTKWFNTATLLWITPRNKEWQSTQSIVYPLQMFWNMKRHEQCTILTSRTTASMILTPYDQGKGQDRASPTSSRFTVSSTIATMGNVILW